MPDYRFDGIPAFELLVDRIRHASLGARDPDSEISERAFLNAVALVAPIHVGLFGRHTRERCHLLGSLGDALHAIACAAGQSTDGIRWLMRAMLRLGLKGLFAPLSLWLWVILSLHWSANRDSTTRLIALAASHPRERLVP